MFPAVFLDRDGVLIENRSDYVQNWSQVKLYPETVLALCDPNLDDYKIVIVTNQSAVGRGIISLETANLINDRFLEEIRGHHGRVDGVYLCPHKPDDGCYCRKPNPGLLLTAAQELSLDLKRSWMIGDSWSDIQAGHAAGVQGKIIVRTGRGTEQLAMSRPGGIGDYLVCGNLLEALEIILTHDGRN